MVLDFVKSNRGCPLLCVEGYTFRKDRENRGRTSWRCTVKFCKARIKTQNDAYESVPEHTHAPDPVNISVRRRLHELREAAVSDAVTKPANLIARAVQDISSEAVRGQMPNINLLRQTVLNARVRRGTSSYCTVVKKEPLPIPDDMKESLFAGSRMGLKFAPNISMMFKELTYLSDRYTEAAKRGFTAVECQFPYDVPIEELVKAKHDSGVEQVLINSVRGNYHGDIGLACHPSKHAEFKKSLELSIRYAKALNCKKIHVMAGAPQPGFTFAESEAAYIRNLCYAAGEFEKEGLMGLIEPLCKQVRNDYFLQSYDKAVEYVRKINSRNIRIMLDVFHLQMLHGNLSANISALAQYVGHVQISQAPKRTEPDAPGEIDYRYVLDLLDELGYRDYIGLEYAPSGRTGTSLKFLKEWGYMPHVKSD